jgi:hypothetical protein
MWDGRGMTWARLAVLTAALAAVPLMSAPAFGRPTDGKPATGEPNFGKIDEQKPLCKKVKKGELCVHWVASGPQKAKSSQAKATLRTFLFVWKLEVGTLGYRSPLPDRAGASGKHKAALDVYLADIGVDGATEGQCVPTAPAHVPHPSTAKSAYCIIDNDFKGFANTESLEATAAHEFFHAVEDAYSASPDVPAWLVEGTAVWIEAQVYATQEGYGFLEQSPLSDPQLPLDDAEPASAYGAWIFWEYVSEAVGVDAVRSAWDSAAVGVPTSASLLSSLEGTSGTSASALLNGFAAWNYELGAPWGYRDGAQYLAALGVRPPADATFDLLPTHSQTGSRSLFIAPLAARYVAFRNATGGTCDITVGVSDADGSLIVEHAAGDAPAPVPIGGTGSATVHVAAGDTVVLVLTNASSSPLNSTYHSETSCT